ncbi:MAG: D-2-hydroxyacid dehydrogenase [Clostridia bacterium]|nr:D-2-hydroxyacid dehydrogenase [Clostridia bacterium]
MVRIVVLDGYCLNPGDLSWGGFGGITDNVIIYDRTPQELVIERAQNADIIILNKVTIDKEIIDALPKLKYIGVLATGYNVVNCEYAKKKGIIVTNIPAYSTESVVQHIFGLIIEIASGIGWHSAGVKNGDWGRSPDFCYYKKDIIELCGKTLGIVGMGKIGQRLKDVALAFGMKVLANNRDKTGEGDGYKYVGLDELFQESDIISLNCPLNKENEGIINTKTIALMKPSTILINASRGGLINESDLAAALNSGRIRAAGLDVLSTEPPTSGNPLLSARNTVITPHIAWATKEARTRLMDIAVANVKAFLAGKPVNIVNK